MMKFLFIFLILISLGYSNYTIVNRYPLEANPFSSFFFALGSIIFYSFIFLLVRYSNKWYYIIPTIFYFSYFKIFYFIGKVELILFTVTFVIYLITLFITKKTTEIPVMAIAIYFISTIVWIILTQML